MSLTPEKVMVSSTCYDLADLRAELRCFLLEAGIIPLLSEHQEFGAECSMNSIETCLERVRQSDAVIVIVSSRYGSDLAAFNYPGVSATHLEYRHAFENNKPVYFFVREAVKADWIVWKKNHAKNPDIEYKSIAKAEDVPRIFEWISEHDKKRRPDDNNWIIPFQTSIDFKGWLRSILNSLAPRAVIWQSLRDGSIPMLTLVAGVGSTINISISNLGDCSVAHAKISAAGGWTPQKDIGPIIPEKTPSVILSPPKVGSQQPPKTICLSFTTKHGHRIVETYQMPTSSSGPLMLADISLECYQTFTIGTHTT